MNLFVLSLFIFSTAFAGTLSVKIPHAELKCTYSHTGKNNWGPIEVYLCKNGQDEFIVTHDEATWRVLGKSGERFLTMEPSEVIQDNESVFSTNLPPTEKSLSEELNSFAAFDDDYWKSLAPQDDKAHSEFQGVKSKLTTLIKQRQGLIKSMINQREELTARTSDGRFLTCKRFPSVDPEKACQVFQCQGVKKGEDLILVNKMGSPDTSYVVSVSDMMNSQAQACDLYVGNTPLSSESKDETRSIGSMSKGVVKFMMIGEKHEQLVDDCLSSELNDVEKKRKKIHQELWDYWSHRSYNVLAKKVGSDLSLDIFTGTPGTNMCLDDGVYYDPNNVSYEELEKFLRFGSKQRSYDMKDAKKVFHFAKKQSDIPWGYSQDGCYARAHVLADRVEKELSIDMDKVWLYGTDLHPVKRKDFIWNYHVAASMNVRNKDGSTDVYIIDPALADGPVKLEDWMHLFSSGGKPLPGTMDKVLYNVPYKNTYVITGNEFYPFAPGLSMDESVKAAAAENANFQKLLENK